MSTRCTFSESFGVGSMFASVYLFVCLFVRSITQTNDPKVFKLGTVQGMNLEYSRNDVFFWVEKSKVVTGSVSAFFTLMTIMPMLMHI